MFQAELVEKCKANDRKAQMALYNRYSSGMYYVALRFVNSQADAEDIIQEAFIKAFQKIDQYKGEVSFGAWLKRIVVNRSLDFIKAQKENMVSLEEHHMHLVDDDDWTVDTDVGIKEVKNALEKLPDKYKHVVMLYLIEGYDHQEIASILDISETACRTRLLRGKGKLKELVNTKIHGTGS